MAKIAPLAYPAALTKALYIANKFSTSPSTATAFPQFSKARVVNSINIRITMPSKFYQFETSLCGPASFYFTLTRHRPDLFAQMVVDLYTTGTAKLGNLTISPSASMKKVGTNPMDLKGTYLYGSMDPVDWMVLAALRDSQNTFLNYDAMSDRTAGITFPGNIQTWFKKVGFATSNNASSIAVQGIDTLLLAEQAHQHGHSVILLINDQIIQNNTYKNGMMAAVPTHWVVLRNDISVDGVRLNAGLAAKLKEERRKSKIEDVSDFDYTGKDFIHSVHFTVFSWGRPMWKLGGTTNSTGAIDLETFLNNYFGFVSINF